MVDFERRQVGNMTQDDIHMPPETGAITLADNWRLQGIDYLQTDPVPTRTHTSEELKAMGLVGITLIVPKPEELVQ